MYPTSAQLSIASQYSIPRRQAHTISVPKYVNYCKYLASPQCRLEKYLDKIEERQQLAQRKEMLIGLW